MFNIENRYPNSDGYATGIFVRYPDEGITVNDATLNITVGSETSGGCGIKSDRGSSITVTNGGTITSTVVSTSGDNRCGISTPGGISVTGTGSSITCTTTGGTAMVTRGITGVVSAPAGGRIGSSGSDTTVLSSDGTPAASATIIAPTPITAVTLSTSTPVVGTAITAAPTPAGATATYQWYTNTSASNTGGSPIATATTASYSPTADDVGNYLYCVATGSGIYNEKATSAVTAAVKPSIVLTSGSASFTKGSAPKNEKFTIGAELNDTAAALSTENFLSLTMDGELVADDGAAFTKEDGSLVIYFLQSYLNTLSAGSHTVTVNLQNAPFDGMSVSYTITVNAVPSPAGRANPGTGVRDLSIWLVAGLAALGAAGITTLESKKRRAKTK